MGFKSFQADSEVYVGSETEPRRNSTQLRHPAPAVQYQTIRDGLRLTHGNEVNIPAFMRFSQGTYEDLELPLRGRSDLDLAITKYREGGYKVFLVYVRIKEETYKADALDRKEVIRRRLSAERIVNDYTKSGFIPNDKLKEIMSEREIKKMCENDENLKQNANEDPEFVTKIALEGYKMMAVFILAGIIPFGQVSLLYWNDCKRDHSVPFDYKGEAPMQVREHIRKDSFFAQWQLTAMELRPLSDKSPSLQYPAQTLLPIRAKGKISIGGYADIWRVQFEHSHQNIYSLPAENNPALAVKEFRKISRNQDFTHECQILFELTKLKHPYIIPMLTGFKLEEQCFANFPFANVLKNNGWNWKTGS